jgi:rhodanese-related sulfurtransferase
MMDATLPGPAIMIKVMAVDLNPWNQTGREYRFKIAHQETMTMQKKRIQYTILMTLILFGFILPSCHSQQDQNIIALSPTETADLIEKNKGDANFIILDIRTPAEYQRGHLKDAIMIDYYSKAFVNNIDRLDREKAYLVYCRSGNRSARSMELFKKLDFKKIYHLSPGIKGWISEGLPLAK